MPVAYGPPDISGLEKKVEKLQQLRWHQKWWGQLLIGIIITIIGGIILALIL
jgi:hypothetical protein